MNHVAGPESESVGATRDFLDVAWWQAYKQLGSAYQPAQFLNFLNFAHTNLLVSLAMILASFESTSHGFLCLTGTRIEEGAQHLYVSEQVKLCIYNDLQHYKILHNHAKSPREVLDRLLVKNTRRKFRTCLGLGGVCYAVRDLFVFRGPADDLRHKASAWRGLPEGYRLRENRGWKTPR